MKSADLIDLAARNIRESMLRNALTTAGIAVGVASLVSMLSLGIGLQTLASSRINQSGLFDVLTVTSARAFRGGGPMQPPAPANADEPRELDDAAMQEIAALPEVREVYPDLRLAAEALFNGKTQRVALQGVPDSARELEAYKQLAGAFFSSATASEAMLQKRFAAELLGKGGRRTAAGKGPPPQEPAAAELAKDLLGKTLTIRYPARAAVPSANPMLSIEWREKPLKIVAVIERDSNSQPGPFASGLLLPHAFAASLGAIDVSAMGDSRRALGETKVYNSFTVRTKTPAGLTAAQTKIRAMGFQTFSIVDVSSGLRQVFFVIDLFLGAFGSLALTVASIGIANTLIMAILERRREIGIMKAIGASDWDIKTIFFAEAGSLGFIGGVFGVLLGWGIGRVINFGMNIYATRQGMPTQDIWLVPWWLILGGIGFAILTSLIAGLYPAAKAARLDPVEALRYQ